MSNDHWLARIELAEARAIASEQALREAQGALERFKETKYGTCDVLAEPHRMGKANIHTSLDDMWRCANWKPLYALAALAPVADPEPQPSDGPDYHAEHTAWRRRNFPLAGDCTCKRIEWDESYHELHRPGCPATLAPEDRPPADTEASDG